MTSRRPCGVAPGLESGDSMIRGGIIPLLVVREEEGVRHALAWVGDTGTFVRVAGEVVLWRWGR
jgi:hypothetical protein